MQRYLSTLLIGLFVAGCATLHRQPKSMDKESQIDALLLEAVYLESNGYYSIASSLYQKLYNLTGSKEILYKLIKNLIHAKRYAQAMNYINQELKVHPDKKLYELAASVALAKKEYDRAIFWITKALQIQKDTKDLEFLGSVYLAQRSYELALKYYKSAYAMHPTDQLVNTIAYIMYFYLDKKKEAIAYLETHIRMYGCEKSTCATLASFYSLQNKIDGLISIYKRLYQTYHEKIYLRKIVELYIYEKNFREAIIWAKKIGDKKLLLDLYRAMKDYEHAYQLALQLYKEKKDPTYLAQAAIFEYERAKKKDERLVKDVANKLEQVIKKLDNPLYENYLGYLYIEHNINVSRGIELVKKALEKEPDSPYYLDSLAWGYYKLHKCKDAWKIIHKVYYELGLKDPEIQSHLQEIQQCLKDERDTR